MVNARATRDESQRFKSLNPDLAEGFVVSLDPVDDDPPLAAVIQSSKGSEVPDLSRTHEGLFLLDGLQVVDGVLGVGQHVFVERGDCGVVILDGVLQKGKC